MDTNPADHVVRRHADVVAVLSASRYRVQDVPADGSRGTLAWLRANACRFTEGAPHQRRRALIVGQLSRTDPAALGQRARDRAREIIRESGAAPLDVMASLARQVPVETLGRALGIGDVDALTAAVPAASAGYLPGSAQPAGTDAAVAALTRLLGDGDSDDEVVASRIVLFVQACEATAGLIGCTLAIALGQPGLVRCPAESLVTETLRFHPPLQFLRRVAVEEAVLAGQVVPPGAQIALDIAAAGRDPNVFAAPDRFDPARSQTAHLAYGAGHRPCPGAEHATRLAAGVVGAVIERCRLDGDIEYPGPSSRVPSRLVVIAR